MSCLVCGEPTPWHGSSICRRDACVEEWQRRKIAKREAAAIDRELAAIRRDWPAEMAATKPFADNVRTRAAGRIGLPATLIGGCSSSSGWNVGGGGE